MPQSSESFIPVPRAVERWSVANAFAALLAAAASAAATDARPALGVAIVSIAWCWWRYAPRSSAGGIGVANLITASRLGLLAAVIAEIPKDYASIASTACLVYAFDGVDGWVARRRGEASSFGAMFDMETDSYVVLLLCVHLVVNLNFGVWVLSFGALRYLYVLARALRSGDLPVRERRTNLGRWVYTLAVVSLGVACVPAWEFVTLPLLAASLVVLVVSFAPDFAALMPSLRDTTPT